MTEEEQVGNNIDLDSFSPVVIRTSPVSGDISVDPATTRMEVEFNKPMSDQGWAWVQVNLPVPEIGEVSFESSTLNVAEGVVMEADTAYRIWLNDPYGQFNSFADRDGNFAIPYPMAFHTGDGTDYSVLDGLEAAVVASAPIPGEDGVDPALDRIEVTFSKDMDTEWWGWIPDSNKTKIEVLEEGWDGARTAWATVSLEPSTTYAVWINSRNDGDFGDVRGTLSAPWLLTFRTADE